MYSEENRTELLRCILDYVKSCREFRCLLQIGSGADGFTDIYSDIDLMAGCIDAQAVAAADDKLCGFFLKNGAVYLDRRKWADTILGISVYFENGLSVDLSFMPVDQIPIATKHWNLLWADEKDIEAELVKKTNRLAENDAVIDEKFHHGFFYAIRKAEIATLRSNYIYADMALHEARQKLLFAEVVIEGKKTHQFKAYDTLAQSFLTQIQKTYPQVFNQSELFRALDALLSLYVQTIESSALYKIAPSHFQIINCFAPRE